jgi:hypothetical protein
MKQAAGKSDWPLGFNSGIGSPRFFKPTAIRAINRDIK